MASEERSLEGKVARVPLSGSLDSSCDRHIEAPVFQVSLLNRLAEVSEITNHIVISEVSLECQHYGVQIVGIERPTLRQPTQKALTILNGL
jgi:hypothetical protein